MAVIWRKDYSNGDLNETTGGWQAVSDARPFPTGQSGRAYLVTHGGYKWSSQITAHGWTARFPLNETVGTTCNDTLGSHDGTYTGGFTLNQASQIAETGTHSILLNGTTGFVDFGSNGFSIGSGSWGFACLIKPTALGAAHRGLFGGAAGSYCASLFNGDLNVGVVGGGNLQIPTSLSRPAQLNVWQIIGLSFDATAGTYTRILMYPGAYDRSTIFAQITVAPGVLSPNTSVKVSQLFKRDSGGFFQGGVQEALFMVGAPITEAMVATLWEPDARTRTTDRSPIVSASDVSASGMGMGRFLTHKALAGQPNDRAEYTDLIQYSTDGFDFPNNAVTEYWSLAYYFPSDSNWQNQFTTAQSRDLTIAQLLGRNLNAASMLLTVKPPGWEGTTSRSLVPVSWGGNVPVAGGNPLDRHTIDPSLGTGWDTLKSRGGSDQGQRFVQLLGDHGQIVPGGRAFTLDVWHEFILRWTYATDAFTGALEWWHRVRGSGAAWTKVAEIGTGTKGGLPRMTVQWGPSSPAHGDGSNDRIAAGGYAHIDLDLEIYHAAITRTTSFNDAAAAFVSEGAPSLIALQQKAYRGRNDDGTEATATWKALQSTDWAQSTGEVFRVRFEVQETAGASGASGAVQLQYNRNGLGWNNVTDVSSVVRSAASSFVADGAATTNQLTGGTGTFTSGFFDEGNGLSATVTLTASGQTEWEFAVQFVDADVSDGDVIALRLTFVNDSSPLYSAVPSITVSASTPPPPADVYRDLILATPGSAHYYRLDDTTTALTDDSIGTADGSYKGSVTQQQIGIPGAGIKLAVDFDGSTGYAEIPHSSALNYGDGPLSIDAWVKRDSTGTLDVILSKGAAAYCLYIATDNTVRFGAAGGTDIVTSSTTLTDTANWHLITVTYNGTSNVFLYLDGVDRTGTKNTVALTDNSLPLRIGVR